jgi:hypothetical protein
MMEKYGKVILNAAAYALMQKWYRKAQDRVFGKNGKRRNITNVSDDEEEMISNNYEWTRKPIRLNASSTALARKWLMLARQDLKEKSKTKKFDDITSANITPVLPTSVGGTAITPVATSTRTSTTPAKIPVKMGAMGGAAVKTSKMSRK